MASPKITLPLSSVALQLKAFGWVNTKTAKIEVSIDASSTHQDIAKLRSTLVTNLKQLTKQHHWHITRFTRKTDQSGLIQIHVIASARLPSTLISPLTIQLKKLSQAGRNYHVTDIDFTPSEQQFSRVRGQLRSKLYHAINQEIKRLDSAFPEQSYYIKQISFADAYHPMPRPETFYVKRAEAGLIRKTNTLSAIGVSNRIQMTASVILTAEAPLQKLTTSKHK